MMLISSVPFIFGLLLLIELCNGSKEGENNLTDQISNLYFDVQEFQTSLNQNEVSGENLLKIVRDLSSTLILLLSELESSKSFEKVFAARFHDLKNDLNDTKQEINETKCSLSTRMIDIENELSKLKTELSTSKVSKRISNDPIIIKKDINIQIILTPSLSYKEARSFCLTHGSKPFVPNSINDLKLIIEKTTLEHEYGWVPLTDIFLEGMAEWDDGKIYEYGSLRLNFTSEGSNTFSRDCVDIDKNGMADWYDCSKNRKMVCYKKD